MSTGISLLRDFPRSRACDATDKRTIILRRCLESSLLPRDNVHNYPYTALPPSLLPPSSFHAESFSFSADSRARDPSSDRISRGRSRSYRFFLPSFRLSPSLSPLLPPRLLSSAFYLASLLFPAIAPPNSAEIPAASTLISIRQIRVTRRYKRRLLPFFLCLLLPPSLTSPVLFAFYNTLCNYVVFREIYWCLDVVVVVVDGKRARTWERILGET